MLILVEYIITAFVPEKDHMQFFTPSIFLDLWQKADRDYDLWHRYDGGKPHFCCRCNCVTVIDGQFSCESEREIHVFAISPFAPHQILVGPNSAESIKVGSFSAL